MSLLPIYLGKCKTLQRNGKIHQVFCLGGAVSVKISASGNPAKNFHFPDIPTFKDEDE